MSIAIRKLGVFAYRHFLQHSTLLHDCLVDKSHQGRGEIARAGPGGLLAGSEDIETSLDGQGTAVL